KPNSLLFENEMLNDQGFRGPDFTIPKKPDQFRIVCLGDSRTFGFGVTEETLTFCGQLRTYCSSMFPDRNIQVINLSVIGYSSFQGKRLALLKLKDLQPDVILCWFGFNDSLFFHVSDADSAAQGPFFRRMESFLNHFAIYHCGSHLWKFLQRQSEDPIQLKQNIVRRVSLNEYRSNLLDLANYTDQLNAEIYFITTPIRPEIPLVLNARLIEEKRSDGKTYQYLQSQYELDGFWLMDAVRFPGSEHDLDRLLEKYPQLPILHYFKALCLKNSDNKAEYMKHIALAQKLDTERQVIDSYNNVVFEITQSTNAHLIDIIPLFQKFSRTTLFIDDCHPNSAGHGLIAGKIIESVFNQPVTFNKTYNVE
ncbi:SGNH/GDSL hydrolase family protein, partial [bacterium]|nr:SGNH/GDSL hydrolase family protein [candidate division CSSED10-310 bacterium]